jgi:hypothetical protein
MTNYCRTGCGRPTQDMLCGRCLTDLSTGLRQLATHGIDAHGDRRPGLLEELEITLTRTSPSTALGQGTRSSADKPVSFHEAASVIRVRAVYDITRWARNVARTWPHLTLTATTPAAMCEWMATVSGLLKEHPYAGALHHDITRLVKDIRHVIDLAPERLFIGQCSAIVEGVECPEDLYARHDRATASCHTCGTEHDVTQRRKVLYDAAMNVHATGTEIARAMPKIFGMEVSADRIRTWRARGKIRVVGRDGFDHPLYRIGDVWELLRPKERAA